MRTLLALALVLAPSLAARAGDPPAPAPAAAPPAAEAAKPVGIAVLEFAAPPADKDKAKALAGVVAARLASYRGTQVVGLDEIVAALGFERQKRALGCSEEGCLQEISGALGVRYLVHGRLDRFGQTALLNAFLFDSRSAKGLLRFSQKVEDEAQLLAEAERFSAQAASALGLEPKPAPGPAAPPPASAAPAPAAAAMRPDLHLNLKLGNTLASLQGATLSSFNVRFDFEADYYFTPAWQAFLQLGLVIGSTSSDSTSAADPGEKSFRMVPASVGVKYTFRGEQDLRPYLGLGLGLGFLNQVFSRDTGSKISLNGQPLLGLAWVPFTHFGLNAEASLNLSGVSASGSGVTFGFTTNFGVLALF